MPKPYHHEFTSVAETPDAELLKVKAKIDLAKMEAHSNAKEVTSKYVGKSAVPWIVLLVIVGVISSAFLPSASLPAVIGLVSTAVMALITMLSGITGTKDKEEKPEYKIIGELIKNLEKSNALQKEPMSVDVEDKKVVVRKGETTVTSSKK
jgi:hypothetical protein